MKKTECLVEMNGKVALHVWTPEGEVKHLLQICHGMSEYLERYDGFAEEMSKKGILVFGIDHPGHGKSDGERGFFSKKKGWDYLVRCNVEAAHLIKLRYPGVKLTILGHSMGSFVARTIAGYYSGAADDYIFMGTAGPNPAVGAGRAIASFLAWLNPKAKSNFLYSLSTKPYGSAEKSYKTEYDWLSRDEGVVEKYIEDENCGFLFTRAGYRDLFTGLGLIAPKKWVPHLDAGKRYLLVSGDRDPVGDMGRGVEAVHDAMKAAGLDVAMKLYAGARHEILNDFCRDEVISDICEWIG